MISRSPGRWVQALAGLHFATGIILYRKPAGDMAADGVVSTVPDWGDRATAFWFLALAPAMWTTGRLLRSAEENGDTRAQRTAGAALVATGATGAAMMPASGFWGVAALGAWAWAKGRRASH
ncbi:hypothetical protein CDO52_04400 [Nocardiopsis gilva YIM 90087]|uniref:Uncharacterized protein n=1 Tax=Nocardiopsis gilva YIM 90087 TaxID=1235441 RepID=A0A223S1X2_9ACTN|nr:DUF6463 family protein [Nocardiopsis gilva]ASU82123.1 hypothetical protein CDO52_04400 [Nocardiopsis gilva YIM 90087]